jgi:NAD(P)-dependent dehydrogenase (short-subunit alcohol dehydrogenase family)
MTVRLDNRVVLVTGTSGGIGRALAVLLAARGAHVVGMARRQEFGDSLEQEIKSAGGSFVFSRGDITSNDDCARTVATATETFGGVDVLVNNAAVGTPLKRIEENTDDDWNRIVDTTLTGTFRMCRAAIPAMREQGSGAIVSLASTGGVDGGACEHFGPYGAAKAGVIQLMRVIAIENADRGIRANSVIIGGVTTPMNSEVIGELSVVMDNAEGAVANQKAAGGLMMPAEQCARSLAVLCSDDALEISGATINLDRCWSTGFWVSNMLHMAGAGALTPDGR